MGCAHCNQWAIGPLQGRIELAQPALIALTVKRKAQSGFGQQTGAGCCFERTRIADQPRIAQTRGLAAGGIMHLMRRGMPWIAPWAVPAAAGAAMIGFLQKGIEWMNPSNTLAAQTYMIIFIIIFIQFRPRGIIALKGRAAGD